MFENIKFLLQGNIYKYLELSAIMATADVSAL